jgi:hypothetical protein
MIVAVITVRMMKVAIDQVVHMVAVRNRLMSASRSVNVSRFVPVALMRRAAVWIRRANIQGVLGYDSALLMVQMAVVQVIDVPSVLDRCMTALRSMLVRMIHVLMFSHR